MLPSGLPSFREGSLGLKKWVKFITLFFGSLTPVGQGKKEPRYKRHEDKEGHFTDLIGICVQDICMFLHTIGKKKAIISIV